jgi:hypothetical protein
MCQLWLVLLRQWGVVYGFACYNQAHVDQGIAWVNQQMEWGPCEEGVEFPGHHHSLPAVLEALGTWEALEGSFEVVVQSLNPFKIGPQLQRRDVDPNEGGNLIIRDGPIHFDG